MSGNIQFLNIFLLIILIGLFVLVVKNIRRLLTPSRFKWIFIVYLIVLLSSPLVLFMLPKEDFLDMEFVSERTLEEAHRAWEFYDWAMVGKPDEFEGDINKQDEWEFEFAGDELELAGFKADFDLRIIIERKDVRDEKIEVISYETRTIVEGVDVTDEINRPKVTFQDSSLVLTNLVPNYIKSAKFNKEFVFTQLEGENRSQEQLLRPNVIGWQVLYVRIPENVEIKNPPPNIQFVDEEWPL